MLQLSLFPMHQKRPFSLPSAGGAEEAPERPLFGNVTRSENIAPKLALGDGFRENGTRGALRAARAMEERDAPCETSHG